MEKKLLSKAIEMMERVISDKTPNPILHYLSLETQGNQVILTGSNDYMDQRVRLWVGKPLDANQHVLIPMSTFAQMVKNAPGDKIDLQINEKEVLIRSGSFKGKVPTSVPEGFPEVNVPNPVADLEAIEFAEGIRHTIYATAEEKYKNTFRAVLLDFSSGLRAVASDGYRLAVYDYGIEALPLTGQRLLLFKNAADALSKTLKAVASEEDRVQIGYQGNVLGVRISPAKGDMEVEMAFRLMEGDYPDYEKVIPKEVASKVSIDAQLLQGALKRMNAVIAKEELKRVDMVVSTEGVLLVAEGPYGRAEEELVAEVDGAPLSVAFNGEQLAEAVSFVFGTVELGFTSPTAPVLVKAKASEAYRAIVVPLRV